MEQITLQPYTLERCHQFWMSYIADPDMMDGSYKYDFNWVERYYHSKVAEKNRVYFAICLENTVIGEIQLKAIDSEKKCATLSIHLTNNSFKNRGFGTEAERKMIAYGFEQLHLQAIYADCLHRNQRSRHILEKLGFQHLRDDEKFCYFVLKTHN